MIDGCMKWMDGWLIEQRMNQSLESDIAAKEKFLKGHE